jgi:hypothetical protein
MKWSVAFALLVAGALLAEGADAPKPPAKEEIRAAAAYILSCDCGNSVMDPGYAEKSAVLEQAGAAVVPILTEMLADKTLSPWFVQAATARAGWYGFSPAFHKALRLRREDRRFDDDPARCSEFTNILRGLATRRTWRGWKSRWGVLMIGAGSRKVCGNCGCGLGRSDAGRGGDLVRLVPETRHRFRSHIGARL